MIPLRDKSISVRVFALIVARVSIKLLIIIIAILLQASYNAVMILIGIILVTELYHNIGTLYIIRNKKDPRVIGAFISACDGLLFILALYFAKALNTDLYLLLLLSIVINTAEFGLVSAIIEGIVAGFSYAIFVLIYFGYSNTAVFFSTYLVRVISLTFFGWITGWLASDLSDKESKLKLVLENDIHEEELNEMKDTFVSDATETLRTPISAVKGYVDIMLNGRLGKLDDKIKEYLNNISTNVSIIESMVGELLHIIEIENDSIKLRKKSVDVHEFIKSIKEDAEAFAKIYKSSIYFEVDIPDGEHISIDEYRLKIAIKNLLAYIFELSGNKVEIEFEKMKDELAIRVTSTIKQIGELEVFEQKDNFDPNTINKNTMLKVYTSKLIIESHDGKIEVKKEAGGSINFLIYLPFSN
jgi:signal transduction histidine kinase